MDQPVIGRIKRLGEEEIINTPEVMPAEAHHAINTESLKTENAEMAATHSQLSGTADPSRSPLRVKHKERPAYTSNGKSSDDPYVPPMGQFNRSEAVTNYGCPGIGRLMHFILTIVIGGAGGALVFANIETPQNAIAIYIVMLILLCICSIQRFRNTGASGFLWLFSLIPILNLWVSYRILACPEGYDSHKTLDLPGKIIAFVFFASLICLIALWIFVFSAAISGLGRH
jgi:uncharacterized membrane protein YhaH (DUF805 family)